MKRKTFITSAALVAAAGLPFGEEVQQKKLRHQVFFWLKNPDSGDDKQELIKGLQTLAAIPVVKQLRIGVPATTEKRDVVDNSWQVSEMMLFDSLDDQKFYQEHPLHLAFVKQFSHLWQRVVVYDIME